MNDALLPVVEEMGRLNEHNFSDDMQAELAITDMTKDVAFNVHSSSHVVDISDKGTEPNVDAAWTALTLFRFPQDGRWTAIWPDKLTKTFTSKDGGMFRILAGAQWGSERIAVGVATPMTHPGISSYVLYGFQIDGALIPDSVIGDQDCFNSHKIMERGLCGQIGSFLLDFTMYLHPGVHTIEVAAQNVFLKDSARRTPDTDSPGVDLYFGSAEILIWEMHR
tara:strand:+ start:782 stop:1447 length:666 start_codon:yes stop_codon:yes gene_type:complete